MIKDVFALTALADILINCSSLRIYFHIIATVSKILWFIAIINKSICLFNCLFAILFPANGRPCPRLLVKHFAPRRPRVQT